MIRLFLLAFSLLALELAAQPTKPIGSMPALQDVEIRSLDGLQERQGFFKPSKGRLVELRARFTATNRVSKLEDFSPSVLYRNESGGTTEATLLRKVSQGNLRSDLRSQTYGRRTKQGKTFEYRGIFLVHAPNPTNAVSLRLRTRTYQTLDIPEPAVRFTPDWPGDTKGEVLALAKLDRLQLGRKTIRNLNGGFLMVTVRVTDLRWPSRKDINQHGHLFELELDGIRSPIVHFGDVDGTVVGKNNSPRRHPTTGAWTFFVKHQGDQMPETVSLSYAGIHLATQKVRDLAQIYRQPDTPYTPELDRFKNRMADLEKRFPSNTKNLATPAANDPAEREARHAEGATLLKALQELQRNPGPGPSPAGLRKTAMAIETTAAWMASLRGVALPMPQDLRPGLQTFLRPSVPNPNTLVDLGPTRSPVPAGTRAASTNFVAVLGPNAWSTTLPFAPDKPFSVMLRTRAVAGGANQGEVLRLGGLSVGWEDVLPIAATGSAAASLGKTNWIVRLQRPGGKEQAKIKCLTYDGRSDLFLTYDGFELMMHTIGSPANMEGLPKEFRQSWSSLFKQVGERAEARIRGPLTLPAEPAESTLSLSVTDRFEFGHFAIWNRVIAPFEMEQLMAANTLLNPSPSPSFAHLDPKQFDRVKVVECTSVMEVPIGRVSGANRMLRPRPGHRFLHAQIQTTDPHAPNQVVAGAFDDDGNFHRVLGRLDRVHPWIKLGAWRGEESDGLIEIPADAKHVELLLQTGYKLGSPRGMRVEVEVPAPSAFKPGGLEGMEVEIVSLARKRESTERIWLWQTTGDRVYLKQSRLSPEGLIIEGTIRLRVDTGNRLTHKLVVGRIDLRVDGQLAKPIRSNDVKFMTPPNKPHTKTEQTTPVGWLLPKEGKQLEIQFRNQTLLTLPMSEVKEASASDPKASP